MKGSCPRSVRVRVKRNVDTHGCGAINDVKRLAYPATAQWEIDVHVSEMQFNARSFRNLQTLSVTREHGGAIVARIGATPDLMEVRSHYSDSSEASDSRGWGLRV